MTLEKVRAAVRSVGTTRSWGGASLVLQEAGVKYAAYPARTVFLAYAFLRGVPYRVVEPTARPLFTGMGCYEGSFVSNIAALVAWANGEVVPNERVKSWLAQPEPAAHLAKRLAREAAAKQVREAQRVAYAKTRAA